MRFRHKIAFYLLPPLLAVAVLITADFKTDLSAFIISGNNAEEVLLASEMQTGTLSRRYLLSVVSDENAQVPLDFFQGFSERLKQIDGVADVWVPGQQNDIAQILQTMYGRYGGALYAFKTDVESELAELFTPEGLGKRAELLKNVLLSPQGSMLKNVAVHDPLLLVLNAFRTAGVQMRQEVRGPYRNLILETEMTGLDAPRQGLIQERIIQTFNSLRGAEQQAVRLEMTGVPVFATATQRLIQGDITRIGILSGIALMALFLLLFRSIRNLIQVFTILIIAIMSAILVTQSCFGYVHGMTVAIGSTLAGICIDYPIHALAHAQSAPLGQRYDAVDKIWPSMLLGGITTIIGYAALGAAGYPGFQQVAVYAGTGIISALLMSRYVLPGLVEEKTRIQLHVPCVVGWSNFCRRYRPHLILLLLLAVCASLIGMRSLHWLQDLQDLTPELNYLKENDKRIRERMISIEPGRFVLVSGENTEAALQKAEQVYEILARLKQQGALADYFGLYPWLLSAHRQHLNQLILQGYLIEENQSLWRQALENQGLSVNRLGRLDYPAMSPLTTEQVLASPVKKLVDSRIIVSERQTVIMIWLGAHEPEQLQAALAGIEQARYFSQRDMLNDMARDYTERAKVLLTMGLIVIFLLLILRYKSLLRALQTLLPALIAAVLVIGVWSFGGASIGFLHLTGFLLVVAICVDYGIFYQENRGGNPHLIYQAMAASMLTSALAFGSLIAAESTSLRILSGVVALGVLLGFLLCPLIIKQTSVER